MGEAEVTFALEDGRLLHNTGGRHETDTVARVA
jgi:hypothetical protein